MPNWCTDSVAFYQGNGKTDRLEQLAKDLEKAMERKEGSHNWIGRLLLELGYTEKETENISCRSFVNYWELREDALILCSESAWSPVYEVYYILAERYELTFDIMAEEGGVGLYLNSDTEGRFFSVHYLVNDDEDVWEYFDTSDEVELYLQSQQIHIDSIDSKLKPGDEMQIDDKFWVRRFDDEIPCY